MLSSVGFSLLIMLIASSLRITRKGRRIRVRLGAPVMPRPFRGFLTLLLMLSFTLGGAQEGWSLPLPAAGVISSPVLAATTTMTTTTTTKAPTDRRYYYHLNHLGGVEVITDDAANTVTLRRYKPYGEMTASGSIPNSTAPFAFQGQRIDGAGGIYYVNARFYSPVLGRFLTADSEIHNPGVPQALNR
jgi:RHS repeat-associated protein